METKASQEVERFMQGLDKRNPNEPEFHDAVYEVVETLMPFVLDHAVYRQEQILERLTEPDRIIIFRVVWQDDEGTLRVNRGYRVQFNNSIGPYKGGLRFDHSVTLSVLKFLAFEQVFKNSLTGLPMGGGKGGANFNPKGKSDREVMRFCQAYMSELYRHIGENTDVPGGDIGVGAREVSYLFGQYKRLKNVFTGTLTGKGLSFGGSFVRTEATGYGCMYFCEDMLAHRGESIEGKRIAISGSGNVAIYAAQRALQMGAKVVTMSDSSGAVYDKEGIDEEKLSFIKDLKEVRRGRISEYAEKFEGIEYRDGKKPWDVPCDVAMPCATQNEISREDAERLVKNKVQAVCEGANMPTQLGGVKVFRESDILYAPAKAANAGGVAVSGIEQTQNSLRLSWPAEKVDQRLKEIMREIHQKCVKYGERPDGKVDYAKGANIAGFVRVAEAMVAHGAV